MTEQLTSPKAQTDTNDESINGIHMETLQGTVHAIQQEPDLGQCKFRARNTWLGGNHNSHHDFRLLRCQAGNRDGCQH